MQTDFPALGTHWWVEVFDQMTPQLTDEVTDFVRQFVDDFEARYSRFKPDSEISRLNRDRVLPCPSSETRALLGYSIDLYRRTRGVFNVMVGHILEARGYDGVYSFKDKGSTQLQPGNPLTDLVISNDKIELLYGSVDVGGYGKGYLIDRLAEQLHDRFGLNQFLINGGGDIYATHKDSEPIEIHLQDPQTKQIVGSTTLYNRAFAASSPHLRQWPTGDGATQHHIVTSRPVKDVVYLTAPNATDADAFATTLLQVDTQTAQKLAGDNGLVIL